MPTTSSPEILWSQLSTKFAVFRGDGHRRSSSLWTVVNPAVETAPCAIGNQSLSFIHHQREVMWCFALVVAYRAGSGQIRNVVAFVMSCSVTNQVLAQLDVLRKWEETGPTRTRCTCSRRSSMDKWQSCTFLHSNAKLTILSEQAHSFNVR